MGRMDVVQMAEIYSVYKKRGKREVLEFNKYEIRVNLQYRNEYKEKTYKNLTILSGSGHAESTTQPRILFDLLSFNVKKS